jgi:hypothetical protein
LVQRDGIFSQFHLLPPVIVILFVIIGVEHARSSSAITNATTRSLTASK